MKKIILFLLLSISVYPQWDWGFGRTGGGGTGGTSRFSAVDLDGSSEYMYRNYAAADSFLNLNGYERTLLPQSTMKIAFDSTLSAQAFSTDSGMYRSLASTTTLVGGKYRFTLSASGSSGVQWSTATKVLTAGKVYYVRVRVRLVSGTAVPLYIGQSVMSGKSFSYTPNTEEKFIDGTFLADSTNLPMLIYSTASNSSVYEIDDIEVKIVTNSVTNGTFTLPASGNTATAWSLGTGVARDDGLLKIRGSTGAGTNIALNTSSAILSAGRRYVLTYQSDTLSGGLQPRMGTATGVTRTSAGVYSDTLTAPNNSELFFYTTSATIFTLDNVHLYEIPSYRAVGNHSVTWSKVDALPNSSSDTTSLRIISTAGGDATSNNAYIVSGGNTYHSMTSGTKMTLECWVRASGKLATGTDTVSGWDFTSGWTNTAPATIVDADSFTTSANGGVYKALVTVGKTYRLHIAFATTASAVGVYNSDGFQLAQIGEGQGTFTFTAVSTFIYIRNTGAGNTRVDLLRIYEILKPSVSLHAQGQTKATANVSVVPGTFTKLVFNFEANSTVADSIRIFVNQSDTLFLDSLRLRQRYDASFSAWIYPKTVSGEYSIISRTNGSLSTPYWQFGQSTDSLVLKFYDNAGRTIQAKKGGLVANKWQMASFIWTGDSAHVYLDGVGATTALNDTVGITDYTNDTLRVGSTAKTRLYNGYIGEILMHRYSNIFGSTFTTSTPLTQFNAYTRGATFSNAYSGGSIKTMLSFDWADGTSDALFLMDLSGNLYNLTGQAVTTADRINWKR